MSHNDGSPPSSRRQLLVRSGGVPLLWRLVGLPVAGILFLDPKPAEAARGAAELDLEYYARSLIGGNRPEGSAEPSPPPPRPPPRTISEPLRSLLLGDFYGSNANENEASASCYCIPVKSLLRELAGDDEDRGGSSLARKRQLVTDVRRGVLDYLSRAERSFYARAPWKVSDVSDQYYFDLTSYALWRAAADVLPDARTRDRWMRQVGRDLYAALREGGHLREPPPKAPSDAAPALNELLALFRDSGFLTAYRVGEDAATASSSSSSPPTLFDEYDDDALHAGATVDCLVAIYEPATLGASLQITGEQSRFAPDIVGPVVSALWEATGCIRVSYWESYFVDNAYRPNPKDYFPDEQLLQFSLTQAA